MKQKKWILILSILVVSFGYYFYHAHQLMVNAEDRINNHSNTDKINSANIQLQNGDIVFRRGADGISDMFVNMNQKDKRYSHCGIYIKKNSIGYIFHSIGGEDNPDEKIRKESFPAFVNPNTNLAFSIYRFPFTENQLQRLDSIVTLWHKQERTFDMDFSLCNDENKMYCVEFVVKAIETAVQDTSYFSRSRIDLKDFDFVAPDDVLLNKNGRKIVEEKFEY